MAIPCEACPCCEWWQNIIDMPCDNSDCVLLQESFIREEESKFWIEHYIEIIFNMDYIH